METSAPPPLVTRLLTAVLLLAAGTPLAGCGVPPELARQPSAVAAPPTTATPGTATPTGSPTTPGAASTPPSLPGADELTARDCQGEPSAAQVIELLRRSRLIPHDARTTTEKAPVCAGSWQYTVVRVGDHEPLQVVSEGEPPSLELVTAGTDVCSIPVRVSAPPGIRTLACP